MADATVKIPGRILVQVRDGVPNVMTEFEIEAKVGGTERLGPNGAGATLSHEVATSSLIEGLYQAIIPLVKAELDGQDTPEQRAEMVKWLREMSEWALSRAGVEVE